MWCKVIPETRLQNTCSSLGILSSLSPKDLILGEARCHAVRVLWRTPVARNIHLRQYLVKPRVGHDCDSELGRESSPPQAATAPGPFFVPPWLWFCVILSQQQQLRLTWFLTFRSWEIPKACLKVVLLEYTQQHNSTTGRAAVSTFAACTSLSVFYAYFPHFYVFAILCI